MKEKIVFILGAGFSHPAGAPLVDEFLQKARDVYANQTKTLSNVEKDFFTDVFAYHATLSKARTKIQFDIDNIEDFFSILDINITSSKDPSLKNTRKALIYLIIKTLDKLIKEKMYGLYFEFLKDLFSYQHQYSFITFNYDLILERALENGDCAYNYCLDAVRFPITPPQTKVLKLHGSSNWLFCSECKNVMIFDQKVLGSLYNQGCSKCGKDTIPLLIPPTWNKKFESDYFESIWHYAFEELKCANKIIIIGYSLPPTDIYFRDFLTLSLKDNDFLNKIIVVDPNADVRRRYELFFETNFARRYFTFINRDFMHRGLGYGVNASEMIEGHLMDK